MCHTYILGLMLVMEKHQVIKIKNCDQAFHQSTVNILPNRCHGKFSDVKIEQAHGVRLQDKHLATVGKNHMQHL